MNQNAIYIDYLEFFIKALFRVRARVSVIKRRRNFFVFAFFKKYLWVIVFIYFRNQIN